MAIMIFTGSPFVPSGNGSNNVPMVVTQSGSVSSTGSGVVLADTNESELVLEVGLPEGGRVLFKNVGMNAVTLKCDAPLFRRVNNWVILQSQGDTLALTKQNSIYYED